MRIFVFVLSAFALTLCAGTASADVVEGGENEETFAECEEFDDMTGSDVVEIAALGMRYSPKCVRVFVGQQVRIDASFLHPLAAAVGENSPIPELATTEQEFEFESAGLYGYYCVNHGTPSGDGMAGAIVVVPRPEHR